MSFSFFFGNQSHGQQQTPAAAGQANFNAYQGGGAAAKQHASGGYAHSNYYGHQQPAGGYQQQQQHHHNAGYRQHAGVAGTYHPPQPHHPPSQKLGAYGGYQGPTPRPSQAHSSQQNYYRPPQVPGASGLSVHNHRHHNVYADIGQLQRQYQAHYHADDTPHAKAFATYVATGGHNYPFIATVPHKRPTAYPHHAGHGGNEGSYHQLGHPAQHHHHDNGHHHSSHHHHDNHYHQKTHQSNHHNHQHEQSHGDHHKDHEPAGDEGNHYDASEYSIISEETRYENWKKIVSQVTLLPNGKIADFEVVDQKGEGGVVIFAWNTHDKTATLIREYNPGCKRMLYGMAGGLIEAEKHAHYHEDGDDGNGEGHQHHDTADHDEPEYHGRAWKEHHTTQEYDEMAFRAAHAELEEEAHLAGGKWIRLVDKGVSIPIEKYFTCEVVPYLVFDAHIVKHPASRDEEELIEIHSGITPEKVRELILAGEMHALAGYVAMLALEKLREIGEIH